MLRSGGVTLKQLTGVCKDIAEGKREVLTNIAPSVETKPSKIHHPFQVREAPSISINIKVIFGHVFRRTFDCNYWLEGLKYESF